MSKRLSFHTFFWFWALFALIALQSGVNSLVINRAGAWVEPYNSTTREHNLKAAQLMSFSFLPQLADWYWMLCLTDPEIYHVLKGEHPQIYYDLKLIAALDPAWFEVYYYGANLTAVLRDDGPGALSLLQDADQFMHSDLPTRGLEFQKRFWPRPWRIPVLKAYVYLFELGDLPSAATEFRRAATYPDAPEYVRKLEIKLQDPAGIFDACIRVTRVMLDSAVGGAKVKQTRQLESLIVLKYLAQIRREFERSREKDFGVYLRKAGNGAALDPWGGHLSLLPDGSIDTTTPYAPVLGLGKGAK